MCMMFVSKVLEKGLKGKHKIDVVLRKPFHVFNCVALSLALAPV